jgi:hypothetical protein
VVFALFIYALVYGFIHPKSSENHFSTAFFRSFFMFLSLPSLGAYFCSICPLAFVGKYLIKLKKTALKMPKFLKNPYISLSVVLGFYGEAFYTFHCLAAIKSCKCIFIESDVLFELTAFVLFTFVF